MSKSPGEGTVETLLVQTRMCISTSECPSASTEIVWWYTAHLGQGGPQPTNHRTQYDRTERERGTFVTDVNKTLGNVSSAGDNWLPIYVERLVSTQGFGLFPRA